MRRTELFMFNRSDYISNRWFELAGNYSKQASLVTPILEEILIRYSEPHRHYHNLDHLAALLETSRQYKTCLRSPDTIDFSIFFHDIIYRAGDTSNEQESASLAARLLQSILLPGEIIQLVVDYILATKNHLEVATSDSDLEYFLDFDLSILSTDREQYRLYSENVRKEFISVPTEFFNAGRLHFLKKLLSKQHIYFTEEFRAKELSARSNIEREILQLTPA